MFVPIPNAPASKPVARSASSSCVLLSVAASGQPLGALLYPGELRAEQWIGDIQPAHGAHPGLAVAHGDALVDGRLAVARRVPAIHGQRPELRSNAVVTPSCACSWLLSSSCPWAWTSMKPGATTRPRTSMTCVPRNASVESAAIRPAVMPTLRTPSAPDSGSMTRPPESTRSKVPAGDCALAGDNASSAMADSRSGAPRRCRSCSRRRLTDLRPIKRPSPRALAGCPRSSAHLPGAS
jgi:hypothetical protein